MNTLSAEMTVGEIAARHPGSVRVFEKHHIDFCCGGKLPIGQACQAQGLNASAVLEEIGEALAVPSGTAPESAWESAPLNALIDHIIEAHHAYLKTELPRLGAMLEKVVSKHSERHGDVLLPARTVFAAMRDELDAHLMKEEMVLFPLIRSLEAGGVQTSHCGSVRNPIRVMVMEHDSAGTALERLRELTSGYTAPEDACNTFRALYHGLSELERDLHQHIHLENNILFPRAMNIESAGAGGAPLR
jgi:regulator of cell morphogenesis and NO signaling